MANIQISEATLVFAPEMNEVTSRWGVYAIPRMWREANGKLIIRFGGEEDCSDTNRMFCAKNLFFVSSDNGASWSLDEDGEAKYSIDTLTGIEPAYLRLKNGKLAFVKVLPNRKPITNLTPNKEFLMPNEDAYVVGYHYDAIPPECKGIYFGIIDDNGTETLTEIDFDFPEWEILVSSKAKTETGYVPVDQHIRPYIFKSCYISSLKELPDGTLVALATGQNPNVDDHYCCEVYLMASKDGGKTWKKRTTIASDASHVPYGYGGDGSEVSLAVGDDGSMYCVFRMDMSVHPDYDATKCWGTHFCSSFDNGKTWSEPVEIADSSVTPHIISLKDDVLLVIYGRPGVHCKFSLDKGKTWSKSYSIIGRTLAEERAAGRSDFDSKYDKTVSYSNTFVEKISDDTVLVCYNDQTVLDANGVAIKAGMVKRITVTR